MITCRPFLLDDRAACLEMFDSNTPDFFANNEREDYECFLANASVDYCVFLDNDKIVGAYGMTLDPENRRGRIRWIMTRASARGNGLGSRMMREIQAQAAMQSIGVIDIAASQKSAPFFARYGAIERRREVEGWGPGLDRVDMEWYVGEGSAARGK